MTNVLPTKTTPIQAGLGGAGVWGGPRGFVLLWVSRGLARDSQGAPLVPEHLLGTAGRLQGHLTRLPTNSIVETRRSVRLFVMFPPESCNQMSTSLFHEPSTSGN